MAMASYFRRSAVFTKRPHDLWPNARAFPKHHEVRFAQHQVALLDAMLYNMAACKQVWNSFSTNGDRKQSYPIQCDMTGAGRSSLPAFQTTIYFISRRRKLGAFQKHV